MGIKDAIYGFLSTRPGIVALIGDNIFPSQAPQSKKPPYAIYDIQNRDRRHHLMGFTGSVFAELRIGIYGNTESQVQSIADEFIKAIDCLRGDLNGEFVEFCLNDSEDDDLVEPQQGQSLGTPVRLLNYKLAYREPARTVVVP